MKQLLIFTLYEFSGSEIGKLKEWYKTDAILDNNIPEFCINEKGDIRPTKFHLQFIGYQDDKNKYQLFDLAYAEQHLHHEIENVGLDEIFKGFDFRKLFNNKSIKVNGFDGYRREFPHELKMIVSVNYFQVGHPHEPEYDCEITIEGYLDENFVAKSDW